MRGKAFFPSVLLCLISLYALTERSPLAFLFILVWASRIALTRQPKLIFFTVVMSLFMVIRLSFHQQETVMDWKEGTYDDVIEVKASTVKWDGDRLVFQGMHTQGSRREAVIVRYTSPSEETMMALKEQKAHSYLVKGEAKSPAKASNSHQFDYQNYLNRQQIYKVIEAKELIPVTTVSANRTFSYRIDSVREKLLAYIDATFSEQSAIYTKALLFADKRDFSEDVSNAFRQLGIVHLLSISGLHVHLFIHLFESILIKCRFTKESIRVFFLVTLPLYGLFTGFGVSVFRAIGMTWVRLVSDTNERRLPVLDTWAILFALSILINPYIIFDIGFQLSYIVTFILIVLTAQPYYIRLSKVKAYGVMNLILFLSSLPILTYHFFEFSWGVLFLNAVFIPFVSFLLLPMLLVLILVSPILSQTPLFYALLSVSEHLILVMEKFAQVIHQSANVTVITGRLSFGASAGLIAGVIIFVLSFEKIKNQLCLQTVSLIGIGITLLSVRYSPIGQVMMIDVGQGDSILIKEPWGKGSYLIDTGGTVSWKEKEPWQERTQPFSVGTDIVVPVLKSQGVHKLNTVLLTHPDTDHVDALRDIAESLSIEAVVASDYTLRDEKVKRILEDSQLTHKAMRSEHPDSATHLPNGTRLIYPINKVGTSSANNHSLVLLSKMGDYTWLFTGDLEAEGEKALVGLYPNLSVDILKVGHHGSQTSTHETLLSQLDASQAWLSLGRQNAYGHPHPSVISRLDAYHIKPYRTDQMGGIQYRYANHPKLNDWLKREPGPNTYYQPEGD